MHVEFGELFGQLELLGNEIRGTPALSDQQKLEYQADIETIKSQLVKPKPDSGILKRAWDSLKGVATIGSFSTAVGKVKSLIEPLLQ